MRIVEKIAVKLRLYFAYSLVNLRRFLIGLLNLIFKRNSYNEEFKSNGFVRTKIASFNGLSAKLKPIIGGIKATEGTSDSSYTVIGRNDRGVKSVAVNINAGFLWDYIFTKELYELIRGYHSRDFYLRNNPTIEFSYKEEENDAQKFHLDWGLQQISVMVNPTDVSLFSTHMIYLVGSNKKYYFSQLHRDNDRFKNTVEGFRKAYPENSVTTVGAADSAFVFDAGNGLHRQVNGDERIMLHPNFVENLAFTYWNSGWQPSINSGAYWFSALNEASKKNIEKAGLPSSLFDLVTRKIPKKFGVPKIYRQDIPEHTEPREFPLN